MKIQIVALLLTATSLAHSRTVTVEVEFNNNYTYDFASGVNVYAPFSGIASVKLEVDGSTTYSDYGNGSFSYYYGNNYLDGATLTSPLTPRIPAYVMDTAKSYNSYAFQLSYDYPEVFIQQFGSRTDGYAQIGDVYYTRSLSIYTGLFGWQAPRNGDGSSDFFHSADQTIEFLTNAVGKEAWFSQSYQVYKLIPGGGVTSLDGKQWDDYSARILSVSVSVVPEGSTAALFIFGLAVLAHGRSRKQNRPAATLK